MYRPILLSVLVYGLLLAGLISLRGELIAFAIPFMLYLLHGFWTAPEELNLQIQRSLSRDRITPDAEATVTVTVTNHGAGIEELSLEEKIFPRLTVCDGSTRHLIRLPKGASHTFSYVVAGARGSYRFDGTQVAATDLSGLIRREQFIKSNERLFIFPEFRRLKRAAIHPRRTRVYAGTIPAHVGGSGIEFFGVREYQFGDSPRTVNWKVSARHAENLYSNEYQQERVADVGIVLDARVRTNLFQSNHSLFEHAVTAAAALSDVFLAQGNRVGLLIYGAYLGWTYPDYGKIQRERIMQALARAEVGVSSVFAGLEHLSPRMFPPESQIVLVSPLVSDDLDVLIQLRGRGYQVMVVSPDPVKFELGLLPNSKETETAARVVRMERDLFLRRLGRAGVEVVGWDVSVPFDQAAGPSLKSSSEEAILTLIALLSSIVISSATLAWGFAQSGFNSFAVWIIVLGLGWLLAIWQRWFWYSPFALIVVTVLAALGLGFGLPSNWLFAGGIFALVAWDMSDFRQRLALMAKNDNTRGIERRHLLRVSLLALAGMGLASITAFLSLRQFTFEWGALLVLVILLGLGQLVGWFRK